MNNYNYNPNAWSAYRQTWKLQAHNTQIEVKTFSLRQQL